MQNVVYLKKEIRIMENIQMLLKQGAVGKP
jgi:hypothetical protein